MIRKIEFIPADLIPERDAVMEHQGVPKGAAVSSKVEEVYNETLDIFKESAEPAGIIGELSKDEFSEVFTGEEYNDGEAILKDIFTQADELALYALTMGGEISAKIEKLFDDNYFAQGSMLDAIASFSADKAVSKCENNFSGELNRGRPSRLHVLSYSPGYCGWHISGQKKLFDFLKPENIGITLNDTFLMTPLKSVTGLLVAGRKKIHIFKNNFGYCDACKNKSCLDRMRRLKSA